MKSPNRDMKNDAANRKRAEERIQYLNTLLKAIRNVSQLIAREKDRERLIQGACECLIEARGYHSICIILLDKSRKLTIAAEAGLGKDFKLLLDRAGHGEWNYCIKRALLPIEIRQAPLENQATSSNTAYVSGKGFCFAHFFIYARSNETVVFW